MNLPQLAVWFLKVLEAAQEQRAKKSRWIDGELEWVTYERQVMFNTVNEVRAEKGLPPVTMKQLRRAENGADGHSDYSPKFALYCAELALTGVTDAGY